MKTGKSVEKGGGEEKSRVAAEGMGAQTWEMLQETGLCVLDTTHQGQRGVEGEGAKEAESLGETAGWQQLDPGSSLGVVGSPQTAGMSEL